MRAGQRTDNGVYPKEKANPNPSYSNVKAPEEPKASIFEDVINRLTRVAGSIQNSVSNIDNQVSNIAYIPDQETKAEEHQEKDESNAVARIESQIIRLEIIERWLFKIENNLGQIVGI